MKQKNNVMCFVLICMFLSVIIGCGGGGGEGAGGYIAPPASSPASSPTPSPTSPATQLFRTGDDPNACGMCGYTVMIDAGNETTYTIDNLSVGTYYFSLTTYDEKGIEGIFSNEIVRTVSSANGSATISWNANTDSEVAGYKIYYGKSN
ncbi:MAG: hypothetical protein ACYDGO_13230 [Smithellaceae bacterium]